MGRSTRTVDQKDRTSGERGIIEMIRISLIVPVYNVKDYLERCVKSILESCGSLFMDKVEIILVNDGSTDGSGDLCERIKSQYQNRICVIHKENGGLSSARNAGLDHANGQYAFFVDSDDWIEMDTIPRLMEQIDIANPDIVKFGYHKIENGKRVHSEAPGLMAKRYSAEEVKNSLSYEVLGNGRLFDYSKSFIISAWASMYKIELLDRSGIRFESEREYLNEDILFNLKILCYAESVAVIHDCFYNYDCRQGSLTQSYKQRMYERKTALIENYRSFAQKHKANNEDLFNARFNQFIIQHMYDCAVAECLWNPSRKSRIDNLAKILNDKNLKTALNALRGIQVSKKAFAILLVMKTANPYLFYYLYFLSKAISNRRENR